MRVPSLKRLLPGGPEREPVIDLTDDAGLTTADDCNESDDPADQPSDDAAGASLEESADTAAGAEHPSSDRLHRVLALLFLTRASAGTLTPLASIALALGWLTGIVLLATTLVTAAIAGITSQALLYPPTLVGVFRIAHGMPVHTADGAVSLVPILPAIAVAVLVAHASGWLWRSLQPAVPGPPVRGPTPGVGLAALAGGYLVIATLVATSPTTGAPTMPLLQGWWSLLGVVLAGVGWVWAWFGVRPARPRLWLLLRAAATVVAIVLGTAVVLVLLRLLLSWSQFQAMSDAVLASGAEPSSRFDAVALGALQLAYLPNVVAWAAAYLVGAGFAVGVDTIISPFSVTAGTLPELPLAVLLPEGALRWPWLPLALVAVASVVAGAGIRSAGLARRMRTRLIFGAAVAAGAAVALGIMAAATSGGLGEGRLAVMGPSPWLTFLWALVVIGLGQVAWALFPTLLADVGPFAGNAAGWLGRVRLPRWRVRRSRPSGARRRRGASRR